MTADTGACRRARVNSTVPEQPAPSLISGVFSILITGSIAGPISRRHHFRWPPALAAALREHRLLHPDCPADRRSTTSRGSPMPPAALFPGRAETHRASETAYLHPECRRRIRPWPPHTGRRRTPSSHDKKSPGTARNGTATLACAVQQTANDFELQPLLHPAVPDITTPSRDLHNVQYGCMCTSAVTSGPAVGKPAWLAGMIRD